MSRSKREVAVDQADYDYDNYNGYDNNNSNRNNNGYGNNNGSRNNNGYNYSYNNGYNGYNGYNNGHQSQRRNKHNRNEYRDNYSNNPTVSNMAATPFGNLQGMMGGNMLWIVVAAAILLWPSKGSGGIFGNLGNLGGLGNLFGQNAKVVNVDSSKVKVE